MKGQAAHQILNLLFCSHVQDLDFHARAGEGGCRLNGLHFLPHGEVPEDRGPSVLTLVPPSAQFKVGKTQEVETQ